MSLIGMETYRAQIQSARRSAEIAKLTLSLYKPTTKEQKISLIKSNILATIIVNKAYNQRTVKFQPQRSLAVEECSELAEAIARAIESVLERFADRGEASNWTALDANVYVDIDFDESTLAEINAAIAAEILPAINAFIDANCDIDYLMS